MRAMLMVAPSRGGGEEVGRAFERHAFPNQRAIRQKFGLDFLEGSAELVWVRVRIPKKPFHRRTD